MKPPIESLIPRYGLRLRKSGVEWIGSCPVDGGTDRFSINTRKQLWNCRGCGTGGDVYDLVQHIERVGYKEAKRILGCDDERPVPYTPALKTTDTSDNSAPALAIWADTVGIDHPLVRSYLGSRKLDLPTSPDVRFHPACPYGSAHFPCIVTLHRNLITNAPQAISRTAIPRGRKLGKAMSYGPTKHTAIKLSGDEEVEQTLVIGEGLETCLSGMRLGYAPVWATGSAPGIRNFPVLAGIEGLTILVDADEEDARGRRAGQDAALECSSRWTAAGREVTRVVPRRIGFDMADVWEKEHRHEG